MEGEKRTCSFDGCDRSLRSDNTTGYCRDHNLPWKRAKAGGADEAPPSNRKARTKKPAPAAGDIRQQFDQLALGLGLDPEQLINDWCEGWVANIKAAAEQALKELA